MRARGLVHRMSIGMLYQLTRGAAAVSTHSRGKQATTSNSSQLRAYCRLRPHQRQPKLAMTYYDRQAGCVG